MPKVLQIVIGLALAILAGPLFTVVGSMLLFNVMVGAGLSMVLGGVSRLLTHRPSFSALTSQGNQVTLRQPVSSWRVIYGTTRVGGIITYVQVTGASGEFFHLVITLAGHLVHSIGTMYFDGVAATEDGTFVFAERNLGTDTQAAFADLVSKSGGKWTSAHQQKGRAGVHVRLKWDQNKFPNGVPNITFDIEGKELYDPRTLTSTFGHNAALALADYLTTKSYGLGVRASDATRIQTSGGSNILKYFLSGIGGSIPTAGAPYELMVFVENIGAKAVNILMAAMNPNPSLTLQPGEKRNIYLSGISDGVDPPQFWVNSTVAGDSLDFLVFAPVVRRSGLDENLIAAGSRTFVTSWAANSGATATVTQNHLASIELDRAQLIDAANTCDEDVPLKAFVPLATDNFNRANAAITTPWATVTGGGTRGQVLGNQYTNDAGAPNVGGAAEYDGGISWPNNQYSEATLKQLVAGPDGDGAGQVFLTVRGNGSLIFNDPNSGYFVYLDSSSGSPSGTQGGIGRPTGMVLGSNVEDPAHLTFGIFVATTIVPQIGDVVRLQAVGTKIEAKVNGATVLTLIDSSHASGRPGLGTGSHLGNAGDGAWDDWSAGGVGGTGTEKRYACNGTFDTSVAPGENIQSLLTSMAGRLTYLNAIFNIYPGRYVTPDGSIGDGDLRDVITVQTTRSKRDLFNGVKGLFVSPANSWQPTDFQPYQNASYVARDGEELWKDVQLPFTTSVATAQRLAKIDLERIRRQVQVVFRAKLSKWTIKPLDTVNVTNARFGWVNKTFEVLSVNFVFENREGAGTGFIIGVDITAVETDPGVYAWNAATEEGVGEVTGTPTLPTNVPLPVTAVTLASGDTNSLVVDGVRYARLKVSWTLPADQFVLSGGYHDVYYRVVSSGAWVHHGRFDGLISSVLIGNVAVGSSYEAFVRSTNVNGVSVDSSTSSAHTVAITLAGTVSGAANRPYRPLSNPLTAHDAGSNVTVNVAAFTMRIQGFGDVSYNSGSLTGGAYNTLYYVYYDDSTAVGGTVSFTAATVKEDSLNNGARFFLGSIQTPRAGGQDTAGNNDGGGGSKVGMVTVLGMTSATPFNSGVGSSVTNPERSFDGDMTTKSTLTILGNVTDGHASLLWTAPPGILRNYTSAVLKIRRALTTNALGGSVGNPTYTLKYYVQGTGSFTNIETANNNTTLALGVASVALPQNINLSTVTVGINIDGGVGATSGSIVLDVYEVWIEATE